MLTSLTVRCIEAPPNTWGNTNKPVPRVLPFLFPESERLMLSIRLPEGVSKDSLSVDQIASLNQYLESGALKSR